MSVLSVDPTKDLFQKKNSGNCGILIFIILSNEPMITCSCDSFRSSSRHRLLSVETGRFVGLSFVADFHSILQWCRSSECFPC